MQSVSSRIWTRVVVSISYDDNHYTTISICTISNLGEYKRPLLAPFVVNVVLWHGWVNSCATFGGNVVSTKHFCKWSHISLISCVHPPIKCLHVKSDLVRSRINPYCVMTYVQVTLKKTVYDGQRKLSNDELVQSLDRCPLKQQLSK